MSEAEPAKASPKHASHPINAMLNYAYVIEAGRLARALAARGLALQIGFLHKPKRGRNSLVWDAIEPLRPMIDARVFEFVASHEFGRTDFPQAGLNVVRLSRQLTQLMLHSVILPGREIEAAVQEIEEFILSHAWGLRGLPPSLPAQAQLRSLRVRHELQQAGVYDEQ